MSEHINKHLIRIKTNANDYIRIRYAGVWYQIPTRIVEKYRAPEKNIDAKSIFADINKKYTKPGALLRGIRIRENMTQTEIAAKLKVTQSDISQFEHGVRHIGRKIAQRIEKLFNVNYRAFLE